MTTLSIPLNLVNLIIFTMNPYSPMLMREDGSEETGSLENPASRFGQILTSSQSINHDRIGLSIVTQLTTLIVRVTADIHKLPFYHITEWQIA